MATWYLCYLKKGFQHSQLRQQAIEYFKPLPRYHFSNNGQSKPNNGQLKIDCMSVVYLCSFDFHVLLILWGMLPL